MKVEQVSEFLENLGWSYQTVADSVITAQYKGIFGSTKVLLHVHDAGLRIAINPVLERPKNASGWGHSVSKLVLALNKGSPSIRIGLDREGDLYVKVDLPKQDLSFEQFVYVLLNICQVSDQLMVPILQAQAYDTISATA